MPAELERHLPASQNSTGLSRWSRLALGAFVVLFHIALLLILMSPRKALSAGHDPEPIGIAMTIYKDDSTKSAAQGAQSAAILRPAKVKPVRVNFDGRLPQLDLPLLTPDPTDLPPLSLDTNPQPLAEPGPAGIATQSTKSASGQECDLLPVITATLGRDKNVRAALGLIPLNARSGANAVMLWDGAWINSALLGGERAIMPIRTAIIEAVRVASPACAEATQTGPRLVPVTDGEGNAIFAMGSGTWRWKDLMSSSVHPLR